MTKQEQELVLQAGDHIYNVVRKERITKAARAELDRALELLMIALPETEDED